MLPRSAAKKAIPNISPFVPSSSFSFGLPRIPPAAEKKYAYLQSLASHEVQRGGKEDAKRAEGPQLRALNGTWSKEQRAALRQKQILWKSS